MSPDCDADVIVIGGGLAGSASAIELARRGAAVLVLERSRSPTLKVCGDFLSAEAIGLLAGLGLDIAARGASPVHRFTLASHGRTASIPLPFQAAGLSRLALDEALLALAGAAGARIERGATATGLSSSDEGVAIEAGGRRFRAGAAVLASGKHNLRGWPRDRGTVTAFKMPFAVGAAARASLAGRVQLTLYGGGYIGACLIEDGLATLCWHVDEHALRRLGTDWQGQLAALSHESTLLGDLLAGAVPAAPRPAAVGALPFGFVRRAAIAPAVYAAGDQLAVIPAFTGDGTSIALASGILAARAILAGEPAASFQGRFAAALRLQFATARAVSAIFGSRPGRRLGIGALALLPALASGLARSTRLASAVTPAGS